jgi:glycosyltransferase involved in cell wall biosynthesis
MINDKSLLKEEVFDNVLYTFIKVRNYAGNGLNRIISMLEFPYRVRMLQKRMTEMYGKPDVIYASSPSPFAAFMAVKIAKKMKVRSVFEVRDLWPESIVEYNKITDKNPIIKMMYIMEKWIYKNAGKIIFTMGAGDRYLIDKDWMMKIGSEKVFHVNNGVDLEEFDYNNENYFSQDKDLNNQDIFKVVYMGSIRKVNHLIDLVDAAEQMQKDGYSNIKLLIYGDGTEKEELIAICKSKSLNNIEFKGRIEKKYIAGVLSKSNLNIIQVQNTGLAKYGCSWNKLFEYMASGKPILSNCPVAEDLIMKHNLGVSTLLNSPQDYVNQILYFYTMDKIEYETICSNALNTIKEYDYKKLTEKIEKILTI